MQFIPKSEIPVLSNSGIDSEQIVFPETSPDANVTITRVSIPVGAINPRHAHEGAEQIWYVLSGTGTLLLDNLSELAINTGDVVRFAPGDIHGFRNTGVDTFIYISVTTPPLNFRDSYAKVWAKS